MDERSLTERLASIDLPPANVGRDEIAAMVASNVETARARRSHRASARLRVATLLACAAFGLAAFAAWTSPGQAGASWVVDRLGFGDPGEPPALEELRASWSRGTVAEGQPAYVLVNAPAAAAGRYEFITYRPKAVGTENKEPCFELDLTQARSSSGQGCGVFPEGGDLYSNGYGGGIQSGGESFYVAGRISPGVKSVDVVFAGHTVDVEVVQIPDDLLERLGITTRFSFFIAFLPNAAHGGDLVVQALGDGGEVLGKKISIVPDLLAGRTGYLPPPQ
ncbi:MAG: hypothetical protein JST08_10020 [Actinobacteria bacterium]|nr:hypothetical protein [Actinomycetota bacterium]